MRSELSAAAVLLFMVCDARAIDRIVVRVEEAAIGGAVVSDARMELDLVGPQPTVTVKARRVRSSQPRVIFTNVMATCGALVIKEPRYACDQGSIEAHGPLVGSIRLGAMAEYDSDKESLAFRGSDLALAGGRLNAHGRVDARGWILRSQAKSLRAAELRKLFAPWIAMPAQISMDGLLDAQLMASNRNGALEAQLAARTANFDLTNEAGTIVAEKLAASVNAHARAVRNGFDVKAALESHSGQTLVGSVLLDFKANPLQLRSNARLAGERLEIREAVIEQRDLLAARARAQLNLGAKPLIASAQADITSVRFPAAYGSFLQIALAATDFGTLAANGTASGAIRIANDAIEHVDLRLHELDLLDEKKQFLMADLRGELHWSPRADSNPNPSHLAWSKAQAYGLQGGAAELHFRTRGVGFELTREARVPLFDGAVVIHSLAARNLGGPRAELDFDAHIEPISMPMLSRAFGWPELSGRLAGRIPGLTYRNSVLALNGDLTANVFDGTITGRNFRLRDPLGPWPRLFADVTARNLDLELVTSTFSIGSITGRLDGDLRGLELFNWSPVAFDARLYSTPADRSRHLISQRAVTSISSIGGGAGGVTKALQSGVLRFFDQFRYDRIGIGCQLRNEVCSMSGVEPHGEGYYLVKGKGVPRIDIIGNAGRVDWPQLVTQIVQGMRSENVIVR